MGRERLRRARPRNITQGTTPKCRRRRGRIFRPRASIDGKLRAILRKLRAGARAFKRKPAKEPRRPPLLREEFEISPAVLANAIAASERIHSTEQCVDCSPRRKRR